MRIPTALCLVGLLGSAVGERSQESFHDPLQDASGRWPADLGGLDAPDGAGLVPGGSSSDLATTAAMLWMLHGDGNAFDRGPERERVERSARWLARSLADVDGASLAAGEALATAVLVDLAWAEDDAGVTAAALRAAARLLETQTEDGDWRVDGPSAIEETGWAAWAMRSLARPETDARPWPAASRAYERAVDSLRGRTEPAAELFVLLFDVADDRGDDAVLRARWDECSGSSEGSVTLEFVATAIAFRLGGETWKAWRKERLEPIVGAQDRATGFWPYAGDGRGSLYELGFRVLTLQLYYRYARNGLVR